MAEEKKALKKEKEAKPVAKPAPAPKPHVDIR